MQKTKLTLVSKDFQNSDDVVDQSVEMRMNTNDVVDFLRNLDGSSSDKVIIRRIAIRYEQAMNTLEAKQIALAPVRINDDSNENDEFERLFDMFIFNYFVPSFLAAIFISTNALTSTVDERVSIFLFDMIAFMIICLLGRVFLSENEDQQKS